MVGLAARACVHFIYYKNDGETGRKEKLAYRDEILDGVKKSLADFKSENYNPPLNTEPIPGGYVYPFTITIPQNFKASFCQAKDKTKFSM